MTYPITQDYIKLGNARSGQKISKVRFIVSHDIGNGGSTARNNRDYFNNHQPSASAHTFIDDKVILEIVPLNEKAWHVQYNKPYDNRLFGDDANDCAIGVELCHGGSINFTEAYNRYVWYHAYLCKKFALNPYKDIVGHYTLDPERRSDPLNAFKKYGISWNQFISDVVNHLSGVKTVEAPKTEVKTEVVKKPSVSTGNSNIKSFQTWLNTNYKTGLALDGIYGAKTKKAAVIAYQTELNTQFGARLVVDGIFGKNTKNKSRSVKKGARGNLTRIIQGMLYCLKYDPKGFDGIFGSGCEAAVKSFQGNKKLSKDGIVGANTFEAMFN